MRDKFIKLPIDYKDENGVVFETYSISSDNMKEVIAKTDFFNTPEFDVINITIRKFNDPDNCFKKIYKFINQNVKICVLTT